MRALALALLTIFCAPVPAAAFGSCIETNRCASDSNFEVWVQQVRIRGEIATVALQLRNLSEAPVEAEIVNTYIEAISENGEMKRLAVGATPFTVAASGSHSLAFTVTFRQPVGEEFDLILFLSKPNAASYAFFGLKQ